MGRVADVLAEWFDAHDDVKWAERDRGLAWAMGEGDDLRVAWERCPRADALVALDGALQAPLAPLSRAVARLARPALALTSKKDSAATRAVYVSEHWGRGALPRDLRTTTDHLLAAVAQLVAAGREAEAAEGDLVARSLDVVRELAQRHLTEYARAAGDGEPDAPETRAEALRALSDAVRERARTEASLRALWERARDRHRAEARRNALMAALSQLLATEMADAAVTSTARLASLGDEASAAQVEVLARVAVRTEARAFMNLAEVVDRLARASAHDAVASWIDKDRGAALFTELTLALVEGPSQGAERAGVLDRATAWTFDSTLGLRHLSLADAVRDAAPFERLARRDSA